MKLSTYEDIVMAVEYGIPVSMVAAGYFFPTLMDAPPHNESMSFCELGFWLLMVHAISAFYTSLQERIYFQHPELHTQPNASKEKKTADYWENHQGTGNEAMAWHVCHQALTTHILLALSHMGAYYLLPGFFPSATAHTQPLLSVAVAFVLQLYIISFGMYWIHRVMHENEFLWKHVHSFHHVWTTPISRITYLDHPVEAWLLSQTGPAYLVAQLLVPLPQPAFYLLTLFRILESLEKHSGHTSWMNVAYSFQVWLPCASQPHHHDYHHEFIRDNSKVKGCNYTFTAAGGLWDVMFGTRKEPFRRQQELRRKQR